MLARKLGLPVGEMRQWMSGREVSEWQAYLSLEARVQKQIAKGMDPEMADLMVGGDQGPAARSDPPPSSRPRLA